MIREYIAEKLAESSEQKFKEFQARLMPTVDPSTMMGVRTPVLRKLAKELNRRDDAEVFLQDLPHKLFDENQLHAFMISEMKDFDLCVERLEQFLPHVDNWATCDQLSPKVFKKNRERLLELIPVWICSDETYVKRFGIGMLMEHFLDDDFQPEHLKWVTEIRSDEYYVNMMIAWYFATALAKQYEAAIPYIETQSMDDWTHNKAIQKGRESNRLTKEQKEYIKTLKI